MADVGDAVDAGAAGLAEAASHWLQQMLADAPCPPSPQELWVGGQEGGAAATQAGPHSDAVRSAQGPGMQVMQGAQVGGAALLLPPSRSPPSGLCGRGQGRPPQALGGGPQLRQGMFFGMVGTCLTCPPGSGGGGLSAARGSAGVHSGSQRPKTEPR